jgi:hypothetical protein
VRRIVVPLILLAVVVGVVMAGCSAAAPTASDPAPARTLDEAVLAQTFDGLGMTPFGPNGELTLDGRRVLDVLSIQGALVRYQVAHSRYPDTLAELSPTFVFTVPRDPETTQDYPYRSTDGGADYELHARLSNGRAFSGVPLQVR